MLDVSWFWGVRKAHLLAMHVMVHAFRYLRGEGVRRCWNQAAVVVGHLHINHSYFAVIQHPTWYLKNLALTDHSKNSLLSISGGTNIRVVEGGGGGIWDWVFSINRLHISNFFFRYEVTIEGNFKTSIIGPVITITEAMLNI